MALGACGSSSHHVEVVRVDPPAPDPTAEPQPDPAPGTPEQDFILSDEPKADPMQLLEATKHDCCAEASPDQIQAGIHDPQAEPATRKPAQR
jgi:hypothetical protein